ncbi:hypothetical protein L207DRAFT_436393, partial [Hyaloscypha variabilis F]
YINYALVGLIDIIYIVYLDNILIYSKNLEDYIKILFINLEKYEFNIEKVKFLGFILSPNSIVIKASRVITIRD